MNFLNKPLINRSRNLALILITTMGIAVFPSVASALAAGDVGPLAATNDLDTGSTTAGAVAYNGFLYNVGGRDSSFNAMNQVQYASISSNGSVGTWTTSPNALPSAQWRSGVVEHNGYLYSIGGINGGGAVAGVYYAPINPNGSVGTWTATASLPQATHSSGVLIYGNHVFVFGGAQSGNVNNVLSGSINVNGSISSWTNTTPLPQAERRQKAIEYNGYVYVVGGLAGSTSTSIYSAKLNNDGTVGAWTTLPVTLPASFIDFSLTENNGYLYLVGGYDGTNFLTDIYFAPLNNDGTMGAWTPASNSLPVGEEGTSSVVYNNNLYVIGGDGSGSAAFASVYRAALTVPSSNPATPPSANTTTTSSAGAPNTGYGQPGHSTPLIVVAISLSVASVSTGFWIYRKSRLI